MIREEFDRCNPKSVSSPRFIFENTLTKLFREIAIKAKVRAPSKGNGKVRKEIILFHALRKHSYRALNRSDVKPEIRSF